MKGSHLSARVDVKTSNSTISRRWPCFHQSTTKIYLNACCKRVLCTCSTIIFRLLTNDLLKWLCGVSGAAAAVVS